MPSPINGPCTPFVEEIGLCCLVSGGFEDPCLTSGQPVSQTVIDTSLQAASEILWAATGRQFGVCEVTVSPCYKNPCDVCDYTITDIGYPWIPVLNENATWTNVSCLCTDSCECTKMCVVPLPYPVDAITEVTIDGDILDDTNYRVDDFRYLVRTDGICWPKCQGSWSVKLTYGRPVPTLVQMATAALACELIKSCVGASCDLPKRMQSLTRQGVTVGFIDPMQFGEGLTGIYIVDRAIKAYNPKSLIKNSSVYSPDLTNKWKRVGT